MRKSSTITNYTLTELEKWSEQQGEKKFRARQLFRWLYQKRVSSFDEMTDLSKNFRHLAKQTFSFERLPILNTHTGKDGSIKFLQQLNNRDEIETVLMKHDSHYTVCVSTQIGCAMGCTFCLTATMGLKRHLSTHEIVSQVLNAYTFLPPEERIRNIVYMGMGEPFHNYLNTIRSLEIFLEPEGFDFSSRRITISTSGLIPQIKRFVREDKVKANLAISLNEVTQEARIQLMPISQRYPLEELMATCREISPQMDQRITFEYILLDQITDPIQSAKKLVRLMHGCKAKINLIPYNENPSLGYHAPSMKKVRTFQKYLLDHGFVATVRISKGQDISAACGQLAVLSKKPKAS